MTGAQHSDINNSFYTTKRPIKNERAFSLKIEGAKCVPSTLFMLTSKQIYRSILN